MPVGEVLCIRSAKGKKMHNYFLDITQGFHHMDKHSLFHRACTVWVGWTTYLKSICARFKMLFIYFSQRKAKQSTAV